MLTDDEKALILEWIGEVQSEIDYYDQHQSYKDLLDSIATKMGR